MFCSLYNNIKRSRNIPHFHSKQTCMSMWRCPRGQTALGALWWTIFHICSRFEHKLEFPQYPENTLDKIRLRDNVSSLHKICQIWSDAWLHESPSNASLWKYTFGCWRQWQEPNLARPAVFRGENVGSSTNSGWIPSLRTTASATNPVTDFDGLVPASYQIKLKLHHETAWEVVNVFFIMHFTTSRVINLFFKVT